MLKVKGFLNADLVNLTTLFYVFNRIYYCKAQFGRIIATLTFLMIN